MLLLLFPTHLRFRFVPLGVGDLLSGVPSLGPGLLLAGCCVCMRDCVIGRLLCPPSLLDPEDCPTTSMRSIRFPPMIRMRRAERFVYVHMRGEETY